MKLLSRLWQSASALPAYLRRKWNNWRWKKHRPQPIPEFEKYLLDTAPTAVLKDYLDRTKGWAGSAPITLAYLKAERRHKAMVKKQESGLLPPPVKHIREGTPEFERVRNQLYGNHPPTKSICNGAQG